MFNPTEEFEFNGHKATIIHPKKPNGKWIWKTEFLSAFDQAEDALWEQGYTRVYYQISDKFGSYQAVRLMRSFFDFITEKYDLSKKTILFGFSRGGLYAFNFALFYPNYVEKVYLDAPVLDMKTWPPAGSVDQKMLFEEYTLNESTLQTFKENPIDNLAEFFSLNIPLLLIAGAADEIVPFEKNAGKLIDFCVENKIDITYIVKKESRHHPHSLQDITPIIEFIER
ncbi:MAG: alpha/beta fold hydrolase [Clostridia bacterium]|nr:alpha/beta fold hydrolase [Clostridia bacterium]